MSKEKRAVLHPKAVNTPAGHMVQIGNAGLNIQNGHTDLLEAEGITVEVKDLGDGKFEYSGPAWRAVVKDKVPA